MNKLREVSAQPEGRGRGTATIVALALLLGACSSESRVAEPIMRDVNTISSEAFPTVGQVAYRHQLNLLGSVWRAPERMRVGGKEITVFREFNTLETAETVANLVSAVQNVTLLQNSLLESSADLGFSVDSSAKISHDFFVFESVSSLVRAESEGLYGPFTTTLVDTQGNTVQNVTLLAPFPFRNFTINSSLNISVYERQMMVAGNIIDVVLSQSRIQEIYDTTPKNGNDQALIIAQITQYIKRRLSENLALAVTIKSGREHIIHPSNDYDYYVATSRTPTAGSELGGQESFSFVLSPSAYEQLVV